MRESYTKRFQGAPWMVSSPIYGIVFGNGGIGSWTALFLSRTNIKLTVVDMDTIEALNIGGQAYPLSSIGDLKVHALTDLCTVFGGCTPYPVDQEVCPDFFVENLSMDFDSPIWISAFDNMKARKLLFQKWKELADKLEISKLREEEPDLVKSGTLTPIFIDGRLTAETFQVYSVTKAEDYKRFENTMFEDDEVEDLPCSFKATSHCAGMIGSVITGLITNHITNCMEDKIIREVPFEIEMSMPLMLLTIER